MSAIYLPVVQEMASRGLSAVYQLGDENGRTELLQSLMGTLQGVWKKAFRAMHVARVAYHRPCAHAGLTHVQASGTPAGSGDVQVEQRSVWSN